MLEKIKQKKYLSQIFLTNKIIAKEIATFFNNRNSNIVEIGSGSGNLTSFINCNKLIIIEIDRRFNEKLKEIINKKKIRTKILYYDAKKILSLENEINNFFNDENYNVVGNLPYHIATKIIYKCVQLRKWNNLYFLVDKNLANKITNLNKNTAFNLFLQCFGEIKKILEIKNVNFHPKPKVDSMLIHLKFNSKIASKYLNKINFLCFLQKCFVHKRKTLKNNLKFAKFEENKIKNFYNENFLNELIRPENLKLDLFYNLFLLLTNNE